eukprot:7381407-Pyramimonas_sp.AAC.1
MQTAHHAARQTNTADTRGTSFHFILARQTVSICLTNKSDHSSTAYQGGAASQHGSPQQHGMPAR